MATSYKDKYAKKVGFGTAKFGSSTFGDKTKHNNKYPTREKTKHNNKY